MSRSGKVIRSSLSVCRIGQCQVEAYFRIALRVVPKMRLELRQDRLSFVEVPRVEAFTETAVDGCKNVACFGTFALIDPKPSQVRCRAKLEGSRLLAASRLQSLVEQGLCLGVRCAAHEKGTGL